MFKKLLELYRQGKLTDIKLDRAVNKGWITSDQAEAIKAPNTEEDTTDSAPER